MAIEITNKVELGQKSEAFAYITEAGGDIPLGYHPLSDLFYQAESHLITEYCSHCEEEVEISPKGISSCPECGEKIRPCSMCKSCTTLCPWGPKTW